MSAPAVSSIRAGRREKRRLSEVTLVALAVVASTAALGQPAATKPAAQSPGAGTSACGPDSRPSRNVLRWTTASELDTFAFQVFRAESKDGPFEKVTAKPILGAGTTDVSHTYRFADSAIEPGRSYWYYIERIAMNGEKNRFSHLIRMPPRPACEPSRVRNPSE